MVAAQELLFAKDKGVPVIDIRPPVEFNAAHIPGYWLPSYLVLYTLHCREGGEIVCFTEDPA